MNTYRVKMFNKEGKEYMCLQIRKWLLFWEDITLIKYYKDEVSEKWISGNNSEIFFEDKDSFQHSCFRYFMSLEKNKPKPPSYSTPFQYPTDFFDFDEDIAASEEE